MAAAPANAPHLSQRGVLGLAGRSDHLAWAYPNYAELRLLCIHALHGPGATMHK